jgi:hypothetical protein
MGHGGRALVHGSEAAVGTAAAPGTVARASCAAAATGTPAHSALTPRDHPSRMTIP